jgi:molybdate transport system regulatory protein
MRVIIPASRQKAAPVKTGLAIRIDLASGDHIGVRLLEEIARTGSISAAARAMTLTFHQAWTLVNGLNKVFGPVIATSVGGSDGGGANLTDAGKLLVAEYRAIEAATAAASQKHIKALEKKIAAR